MASPDSTTYTSLEQQFVGILTKMNAAEASADQNAQNRNYVRMSYDQDNGIITGSANLPATMSVDANGNPTISVTTYLTDPA